MKIKGKKRNYGNSILNMFSKVLTISIIILFIIFIYSVIKNKYLSQKSQYSLIENVSSEVQTAEENINNTNLETQNEFKKDTTINMAFTGDIMCHNTIYKDALSGSSEYNFSYIFEDIKYYLETADITIGNLETTFAGSSKGYSGYPTFNTPEALAYNLKEAGFDVVSTANNHCYDSGYNGIESTIDYLNDAGLAHTGTYKSEEEQNKILIKNVNGINIAFLSFTYGTNGIPVPSGKSYSVNLINEELILNQLSLAKEQNPDIICVCMHWGNEYQTSSNTEQEHLADFLFENGADIIIGNHPHVLQNMEKREITLDDGSIKDGFVVYSLGNFLADQNKSYTRNSVILNLNITKNTQGKISINSVTYTPIYTYKNKSKSSQKFKIIDLENAIANYDSGEDTSIGSTAYNTFTTELGNIKKLIGEEIN